MDKSINLIIDDTKLDIVNTINESHLPISIVKMIVEQLYREIADAERQQIAQERQQLAQNEETKNDKSKGSEKPE